MHLATSSPAKKQSLLAPVPVSTKAPQMTPPPHSISTPPGVMRQASTGPPQATAGTPLANATIPTPKSGWKYPQCPICHQRPSCNMHHHAQVAHPPWPADPTRVCWTCFASFCQPMQVAQHFDAGCPQGHFECQASIWVPLVNRMFTILAQGLHLLDAASLFSCVARYLEICPSEPMVPTEEDLMMMLMMDVANNTYQKDHEYKYSPPSAMPCLLQWKIFA